MSEDLISRRAALEWLKTEWDGMVTSVFDGIEQMQAADADGCDGCKYVTKDEYEMPCLVCKRNHMDKWRPRE